MQIYLLRHGIAEEASSGMRDAERVLTLDGRRKLRSVLERAGKAGVAPSLILSSPLKRALQTAEMAAEVLAYKDKILTTRVLEPSSDPEAVWEELRAHKQERAILLSGHEPLFSALTAFLLDSPSLRVDFKKGAMARVDLEPVGNLPRGLLRWMMTAKLT